MLQRSPRPLFPPPSTPTLAILIAIVVSVLRLSVCAIGLNPGRTLPLDLQLHPLIRHVLEVEPNLELDILAKVDKNTVLYRKGSTDNVFVTH